MTISPNSSSMSSATPEPAVVQLIAPYFAQWWPYIEKELDTVPHIWAKFWTKDYLYSAIEHGMMQCWIAIDEAKLIRLVVVTQVAVRPNDKVLQVVLALGNGLELMLPALSASLEWFAKEQGCEEAEVVGRAGWQRLLVPLGFHLQSVTMVKDVELRSLH